MQANVKTKNGKKLKVKTLVDSGYTYIGINEQLVKDKRIQTKPINFSFEVFNADGTKNGEVTKVASLEIKINGHKETLEAAVTDLDRIDMFLGHDWLVKHNPEVNWKNRTIKFMRCLGNCTMKHEDIQFKSRRTKAMETTDNKEQDNREIGKEPDKTNPEDLPEYIRPFTHLFNKKKFEKLPERHEWDHEINLTDEAPKKLNAKAYTMTLKKEEALNQWLDKQLKAGLIVESKSRYAVPCFYIPKKDSSLWLVQDYRKLNQVTIKNKMPLPLIGEVINKLKEARYFNKLDLIWGYNNIRIKEGNKWKAIFLTNKGLFEPQVMYFGLCNSPGTFQRMMNSIFRELLHEGVLANYMDDFVIPAKTMEELEERTIRFLKIAEKHNLCFKRSKYNFNMEEIPILEVVVGKGQVKMEQEKIKAVKEWKTPTKVKDIESFLRFANFYQQFIHNFSHTARSLNELNGKKEWKWEEEHQKMFEELKEKMTSQPVLSLLRREGKFRVETDASGHAIGGVLSQEQDGKWKLIAFLSRMMQPAEQNYEIYNKELLAIVEALTKWRQYLLDAKEPFEVWTDHENLKYFREPHKLNG